jgi:hypothetical protein
VTGVAARIVFAGLAVAAGVTAALVVATSGHGAKAPTRGVYLAQARAICREFSKDLDRIPPIQDPTFLGQVLESTNAALPLLREQSYRIHALTPPSALRSKVSRFFVLTDRSIDTLASVRDAAFRMNTGDVGVRLIEFGRQTEAAKRLGSTIGYRC